MPDSGTDFQRLAPYVLGRARRGVVGSSRYAQRLRTAVLEAARDADRRPVLISGEPGLEKDNLAALIHFGSGERLRLLLRLDPADLQGSGRQLLDHLGENSLLVSGIDRIEPSLQQRLVALARGQEPGFQGRVMFTSESPVPCLDAIVISIRVPPLRVRRSDLGDWLRYQLRLQSTNRGWNRAPQLPDSIVRRLQNHDFPNNIRELEHLVDRALRQAHQDSQVGQTSAAAPPTVLPEAVFWTNQRERRLRFDLWRWKPQLREWMRSPSLWNGLLFGLVSWLFVAANLALWLGPQNRAENPVLILFWAWWWPLILLTYPLVGRLWCAICPFMVWGEIAQRLTPWRKRVWPHGDSDRWAAPLLAAGFAAILVWEEVWNLEDTAWLSSCLLLLITAGAVLSSLVFEKRFWCRHLCPVGGMNGLFAKLSILELRAEAGTCGGSCSSYACFKGGPADGEGLASKGCPLGTHPAHLSDNRDCVLCLTCAQACPNRSVQLRLRPPAADLQPRMQPPDGERGLILVLAGGICLHHWQRLLGWLPLTPDSLQEGALLPRLSIAVLARHLPLGMGEGSTLLPEGWPQWQADPHVIGFAQTLVVVIGWAGAVALSQRLMRSFDRNWRIGMAGLVLISVGGRWLVAH